MPLSKLSPQHAGGAGGGEAAQQLQQFGSDVVPLAKRVKVADERFAVAVQQVRERGLLLATPPPPAKNNNQPKPNKLTHKIEPKQRPTSNPNALLSQSVHQQPVAPNSNI